MRKKMEKSVLIIKSMHFVFFPTIIVNGDYKNVRVLSLSLVLITLLVPSLTMK